MVSMSHAIVAKDELKGMVGENLGAQMHILLVIEMYVDWCHVGIRCRPSARQVGAI